MDDDSIFLKVKQLAFAMLLATISLFMVWGHFKVELFP